jgi:endo-beta-N-acetylglucosaminidase D
MTDKEENGAPSQASSSSQGNKVAVQLKKMRDANLKYKDLLKMAKDRITKQEDELKRLRGKTIILVVLALFLFCQQVK